MFKYYSSALEKAKCSWEVVTIIRKVGPAFLAPFSAGGVSMQELTDYIQSYSSCWCFQLYFLLVLVAPD